MLPSKPGATNTLLDGCGLAALLALAILAPLPYGAIQPGGTLLVEVLAFASAALAFASSSPRKPFGRALVPLLAIAAIALVGLLQLAPLPESLLRALSPASHEAVREAAAALRPSGDAAPAWRISIAPTETRGTVLLVLA